MRFSFCIIAVCAIAASLPQPARSQANPPRFCANDADSLVTCVKPSDTDSAIRRFDEYHYVLMNPRPAPGAQLLVFLTGTGGEPPGPLPFLKAAAAAGYRVISLAYNDTPAVAVYCPRKPDAACSEKFRRMRIYGDGTTVDPTIDNPPAESIVNRLIKLLQYLDRREPQRGWDAYLENGAPAWGRLVFAGQSQGAGMAAFIAKQHALARVILFSSPWDFVARGNGRQLAPWIALPSVTPPDRWYGGYHARENMAALLAKSYAELRIPSDHIRVFDLDLPPARQKQGGDNPYHGQGISNPAYAEQRAFFLGHSP
jgi:hypothetical protein